MSNEGAMICFVLTVIICMCAFMFIRDDTLDDENEEFNMRRDRDFR